jgi:hypothetical protein
VNVGCLVEYHRWRLKCYLLISWLKSKLTFRVRSCDSRMQEMRRELLACLGVIIAVASTSYFCIERACIYNLARGTSSEMAGGRRAIFALLLDKIWASQLRLACKHILAASDAQSAARTALWVDSHDTFIMDHLNTLRALVSGFNISPVDLLDIAQRSELFYETFETVTVSMALIYSRWIMMCNAKNMNIV